jgi:hypothetical protein
MSNARARAPSSSTVPSSAKNCATIAIAATPASSDLSQFWSAPTAGGREASANGRGTVLLVRPEHFPGDGADAAQRADERRRLHRHQHDLAVAEPSRSCSQRLGVFLRDEVVDRLDVALGDRLGDDLGGTSPRPRRRVRAPRRRGMLLPCGPRPPAPAPALRPSASRICARLLRSAIIWRRHRFHEVGRRVDVLDLDAGHLDAPRACAASSTICAAAGR